MSGQATLAERRCPYCGGPVTFSFSRYQRRYLACGDCALHFSAEPVCQQAAYRDYAERYDREWRGEGREGIFVETLEQLTPSPGKLLDVGCGGGTLLRMADERGWDAYGVEPGLDADGWAHAGMRQKIVPSLEAAATEAPYDAATLINVVDQVSEPWQMLHEVSALLRDGGAVVIRLPNFALYQHLHSYAAHLPERWHRRLLSQMIIHEFGISTAVLSDMLHRNGFTDIRCRISSPSSGDVYNQGWRQRWLKHAVRLFAFGLYYLSFGHLLLAPSVLVTATKGKGQ